MLQPALLDSDGQPTLSGEEHVLSVVPSGVSLLELLSHVSPYKIGEGNVQLKI